MLYSVFFGNKHEHNVMFSCKIKAVVHLFLMSKHWMTWNEYPYMIVYHDNSGDGVYHVVKHVTVKTSLLNLLSESDVVSNPSLLDMIV